MMKPYELPPLDYDYAALEPHYSARVLELHHDKHHKAYVDGVNGTLEALDMGVPVVTLCGKKHGERTSYSILENLGVRETMAASGSEYVDIAVRLATDLEFMSRVRAGIGAGLRHSTLIDMRQHARALEAAYEDALRRAQSGVTP